MLLHSSKKQFFIFNSVHVCTLGSFTQRGRKFWLYPIKYVSPQISDKHHPFQSDVQLCTGYGVSVLQNEEFQRRWWWGWLYDTMNVQNTLNCMCAQSLSRVQLFLTPWTVSCQATLSLEFSSKENWGGSPVPSPGDLPDLGNASPALAVRFFTTELSGVFLNHN